jgi:hypothetical protein
MRNALACLTLVLMTVATMISEAAADGVILLTQSKALAGNVTPGDTAGFPISLTRPGSYRFESNIYPPSGKNGIAVISRNVAIDLNGFELYGANAAAFGIISGQPGTTIRGGTISDFTVDGVSGNGAYWIVENMRVVRNSRFGIKCGRSCLITDSNVAANLSTGILIQSGTVLGNSILDNGGPGISGNGGLVGFGNNTLFFNNNEGPQVFNASPLEPNVCEPACP